MLNRLLRRIIAGFIAAGLAAGAASVSVAAAGFALYAILRQDLAAPLAGLATALGFCGFAAIILVAAPRLIRRRTIKSARGRKVDSEDLKAAFDTIMALLATVAAAKTDRTDRPERAGKPKKTRRRRGFGRQSNDP